MIRILAIILIISVLLALFQVGLRRFLNAAWDGVKVSIRRAWSGPIGGGPRNCAVIHKNLKMELETGMEPTPSYVEHVRACSMYRDVINQQIAAVRDFKVNDVRTEDFVRVDRTTGQAELVRCIHEDKTEITNLSDRYPRYWCHQCKRQIIDRRVELDDKEIPF